MTIRTEQVASVVQRSVQQIITRDLNDPRVRGLISVTGVRLSPDLREATVRVSILPEEQSSRTMHGLASAAGHIQRQLRRYVELRRVPRLHFELDESMKREAAIHAAIDAARRDEPAPRSLRSASPEDPST